MFNKIVSFYKEVKRLMDKKYEAQAEVKKEVITACKEVASAVRTDCKEAVKGVMSNAQNRLTIGLVLAGTGVAFIASAYIHVPA